ncbi:ROK family transcriptional regulator [Ammoniphilus sp. YIM 78166]|uniref:ROK family transcriptional regulator n=1 Tax=Ammoniphilus sp. YIM 78166 TaxID=1644106 RepID=UPI00106F2D0D|nr:ROK family transcriptional regulator [Ammoniphilus sp. YIM 78166]
MNTGDAAYIRNLNRNIILENIILHKNISRAELSKITGLNKATISSQINSLLEEGLIFEKELDKSNGGRKPILLTLDKDAGFAVGVEIDTTRISFLITDLSGKVLDQTDVSLREPSFEKIKDILITTIDRLVASREKTKHGLVGIGIGVQGIVDNEQRIVFTPRHQWKNVDLQKPLEDVFQVPVHVDNNANLCAFAELVYSHDTSNLLCISTYSGIGLGIVINKEIYRGMNGFAGEIGHMIIQPNGRECPCGNLGCWEQYASEKSFWRELNAITGVNEFSMDDLQASITNGDPTTLDQLSNLSTYLGMGINNVINLFNPETIIINSQLSKVYPELISNIKSNLSSYINHYRTIQFSELGKYACAMGACAMSIQRFLGISHIRLELPEQDNLTLMGKMVVS